MLLQNWESIPNVDDRQVYWTTELLRELYPEDQYSIVEIPSCAAFIVRDRQSNEIQVFNNPKKES